MFLFENRKQNPKTFTVFSRALNAECEIEHQMLRPFLRGANIRRYSIGEPEYWILYPYKLVGERTAWYSENEIASEFPNTWRYLKAVKQEMSDRGSERMNYPIWYGLWNARDMRLLGAPKILTPTIAARPSFSYDQDGASYFLGSGAGGPGAYGIIMKDGAFDPLYVLGLMNSRIVGLFMQATSSVFSGGYWAYSQQFLWDIPFRPVDLKKKDDREMYEHMVSMVRNMLVLQKGRLAAKTPTDQARIDRDITALDRQIDALVYRLYGLTNQEIAMIEG